MRKDQRDGSTDPQIIYHRNLSTEHTEDTDFFSCLKARNLWGKSFLSIARAQEIYSITREPKSLNENH